MPVDKYHTAKPAKCHMAKLAVHKKEVDSVELEKIRLKKGLTRRELSLASGVTENSIYRYERKGRIPDLITAIKLSKALDCKAEDLAKIGKSA